jgi:hypothetical protein
MGGIGPQLQVGYDLLDDLGLVNQGNDTHRSPTPRTARRSGHVDLLDKLGSALFEGARDLFFESRTGRAWQCRLQPLIYTGPAMVELNRQAARDEKGKDRGRFGG